MRTTFGPQCLTVLDIRPGSGLEVFRIVRSGVEDDPVLLNSLRSNYEMGEEPRKVERASAVIHMGISAYVKQEVAHETAQRFPKIGEYVAQLALESGYGFNYAFTGHPQHLTLWADPVKLQTAIVDIRPVGQ